MSVGNDGLTDAEREAISAFDADETGALEELLGDEDGEEDEQGGEDDGTPDGSDDAATPEVTTIPFDPAADPVAPVVPEGPVEAFRFIDDGVLLPQFEQAMGELHEKMVEGDVSAAEYHRELNKLQAANRNTKEQGQYQEWQGQQWDRTCNNFYTRNPEWTQEKLNPVVWGAFNAEVIRVGQDPRCQWYSGAQVIEAAKQNVADAFGMKSGAVKPQAAGKAATMPRPTLQTLAHTPAADANEIAGEFAALDKLSGLQLEAAVSKMSSEQVQRYLHGQG